jgi:hypothetical protein
MKEELERIALLPPWEVRRALLKFVEELEEKPVKVKRTSQQNRRLHQWMKELADEFNDRGLYMQQVLKNDWDIVWTMETVKDNIVRPIANTVAKTEHTSELSVQQIGRVIDIIDKNLLTKHGIDLPFSDES